MAGGQVSACAGSEAICSAAVSPGATGSGEPAAGRTRGAGP